MLSSEQISKNKENFKSILESIKCELYDIDGLLEMLDKINFFNAPASTKYHCSYEGGLCEHSLNVYNELKSMIGSFENYLEITTDDIVIVGLLHDVYKAMYYEKYEKNVKNESSGQWEKVVDYRVKDAQKRFTMSTCAINSMLLINQYIPLNEQETATLINFNCGMDDEHSNKDLGSILSKYPLTVFLHNADMLCTYVIENE